MSLRSKSMGLGLLAMLCAAACGTSGGQSGTEALDVSRGQHADGGTVNQEPPDATPAQGPKQGDKGRNTQETPAPEVDSGLVTDVLETATDAGETATTERVPYGNDETTTPEIVDPSGDTAADETTTDGEAKFELYFDYYQEPCEGALFCLRSSDHEGDYVDDSSFEWPEYKWGHRYRVEAHWPSPQNADASATSLVIDRVLEDTPVAEGTQFTLRLDSSRIALGLDEQITFLDGEDPEGGTLGANTEFRCPENLSPELEDALGEGAIFDATFEFDATQKIWFIGLEQHPELESVLAAHLEQARRDWEDKRPTQYVVKICGTGFDPPFCTLAAVNAGEVVAAEQRDLSGDWAETTLDAEPLGALFDSAKVARVVELDPTYGYVSSYTQVSIGESGGRAVRCFAPDTLDLEQCRDSE
jgi:hypothetical protein